MSKTTDPGIRELEEKDYQEFLDWVFKCKRNPSSALEKILQEAKTFGEVSALINEYISETGDESIFDEYWAL